MFRGKSRPSERNRKRFIRLALGIIVSAVVLAVYLAFWQRGSEEQDVTVHDIYFHNERASPNQAVNWNGKEHTETAGVNIDDEQQPLSLDDENNAPLVPDDLYKWEGGTPKMELTNGGRLDPVVIPFKETTGEPDGYVTGGVDPPDHSTKDHPDESTSSIESQQFEVDTAGRGLPAVTEASQVQEEGSVQTLVPEDVSVQDPVPEEGSIQDDAFEAGPPVPDSHPPPASQSPLRLITLYRVASLSTAGFCPAGCDHRGVCNPETRTCECPPGIRGASCELHAGDKGEQCPRDASVIKTPAKKNDNANTRGGLCPGELPLAACWRGCSDRGYCVDLPPPAYVLYSARTDAAKADASHLGDDTDAAPSPGDPHGAAASTASAPPTGSCACYPGYRGHACEHVLFSEVFCINACHWRGTCIQGFCLCRPGFWGIDCGYDLLLPALPARPWLPSLLHPPHDTSASSHKASNRGVSPPGQHAVVAFKRYSSHRAWCYPSNKHTSSPPPGGTSSAADVPMDGCHSGVSVGAGVMQRTTATLAAPGPRANLVLAPWLDHRSLANASLAFLADRLFGSVGGRADTCGVDLLPTLQGGGPATANNSHATGRHARKNGRTLGHVDEALAQGAAFAAAGGDGAGGCLSMKVVGASADASKVWRGLVSSSRPVERDAGKAYRLLAHAPVLDDLDRLLPGVREKLLRQLAATLRSAGQGSAPIGAGLADAPPAASSPRIFVYDLPPSLTVHPEDLSVQTANFGNGPANLYSLETRFHAALLRSRHRVLSPATAELLHAPVWDPIGAWGPWGAHVDAVRFLRAEHGLLFESRGADHVWVVHRDLGSCGSPAPLAAGIFVSCWGGERGLFTSQRSGWMRRCFQAGRDIVAPPPLVFDLQRSWVAARDPARWTRELLPLLPASSDDGSPAATNSMDQGASRSMTASSLGQQHALAAPATPEARRTPSLFFWGRICWEWNTLAHRASVVLPVRPVKELSVGAKPPLASRGKRAASPPAPAHRTAAELCRGRKKFYEEYSYGVRQAVWDAFQGAPGFSIADSRSFAGMEARLPEEMQRHELCLAPTGIGWGVRVYEAIMAGCVPVVIQDDGKMPRVRQAFEGEGGGRLVPWHRMAVLLMQRDIPCLPQLVRNITQAQTARAAWSGGGRGQSKRRQKGHPVQAAEALRNGLTGEVLGACKIIGVDVGEARQAMRQHWTRLVWRDAIVVATERIAPSALRGPDAFDTIIEALAKRAQARLKKRPS